jgi:large repetitive protein
MKISLKPITNIQSWRLAAIAIGSAVALALPTAAFAVDSAPTAIATMSPTAVWEGDTVTVDASQSHTNPCCNPLTYQWQQQAGPTVALSPGMTAVSATFIAPAVPLPALTQAVTFRIKVTDNLATGNNKIVMSAPVTTTVYASPGVDAEPKGAHVNEGTLLVQLTGTPTRTQPGATFTYTWTAPAGITLSDIHAQNPRFTAPQVGPAGQALTFTLKVTEHLAGLAHDQDSAADSVTINVDNVNAPPTATANTINDPNTIVSMATVDENTSGVALYGFGSDPDGDALSFHWTQVHDTSGTPLQPGDTAVTLSDNTSPAPTFDAPNLTTQDHVDLVFQLITNDGQLNSGPSYVTIRVHNTNTPPTAVPTATPASALEGHMITLDGSQSSDPDNDPLTYSWAQTAGTSITLAGANSQDATFIAPAVSAQQGQITLSFDLTVDDGRGGTDTKPVSITVSHVNQTPVAQAITPVTVPELSNLCLDGSASYDPDGDTDSLTYAWSQIDGPAVSSLFGTDTSGPCFDSPNVGPAGATLHFQLTVTDSHGASSSTTVEVDVTYVNHPPTANPGSNQTVHEGDTVHLDGSFSSDPDNNPLTFTWSQFSGPQIDPQHFAVDPSDPSKATFTAPQVPCAGGEVVMTLTVDDGYGGTDSRNVTISIANVNHLPTAIGGGNQQVSEGDSVSLNGSGTDADTEEVAGLAFQWTQTSGASVALNGSGKDVSFTAPTIPGGDPNAFVELGFRLTVDDHCTGLATDDVTVHVANIPHAPVAVATGPASANEGGSTVMLDGSMSSDPDFDPLTYVWTQISGPAVTLVYSPGDTDHVMPSFATPWVSVDTQLKFKLTVSDWPGSSSSAYVTVTIVNWHTPPDASHAHADVSVLWPPDHKMAQVHIIGVIKPSDDKIAITGVTQDEPTNGLGDGDTPIDAIKQVNASGDDSVLLRAERSGNGDGRVYRVSFHIDDPEQPANGSVNVSVPKSKKTDAAIDSGGTYDSTH